MYRFVASCVLSLLFVSSQYAAPAFVAGFAFVVDQSSTPRRAPAILSPPSTSFLSGTASTCRLFAVADDEEADESKNDAPPPQNEDDIGGANGSQEDDSTVLAKGSASDILNSPAFLQRKLEVLKSDIKQAEEEIEEAKQRLEAGKEEWGSQLDALQSEYQNIQERMNTQGSQGDAAATVQVAQELVEVLDNYDRAFGAVTPENDQQRAVEAEYRATYDLILETLEKRGVERVETVGTEFDFAVHQAVMQRPSDEYEEGIVMEEYQTGFKLGETLIRPAMVAVAA